MVWCLVKHRDSFTLHFIFLNIVRVCPEIECP